MSGAQPDGRQNTYMSPERLVPRSQLISLHLSVSRHLGYPYQLADTAAAYEAQPVASLHFKLPGKAPYTIELQRLLGHAQSCAASLPAADHEAEYLGSGLACHHASELPRTYIPIPNEGRN